MEHNFWIERWQSNEIGFHQNQANALLVKYIDKLELAQDSRIFIPLCGKTLDIAWLLAQGYRVVGCELVEMAVEQLFAELGVEPRITQLEKLKLYQAENLDIFVGDIFDMSAEMVGSIDAIYDRAALIALPQSMREDYSRHLMTISQQAPQLLITLSYDQTLLPGPPFSLSHEEVRSHYQQHYDVKNLEATFLPTGLKGQHPCEESVWLLL